MARIVYRWMPLKGNRTGNSFAKFEQEFWLNQSRNSYPPQSILVLTDILLKSDLSPEQKKDLDTIKAAGNTLLAV
ncbi:hypothetical protein D5R40_32750 [Okeania hirsuta]|uniref:Uncharacterized protein n=1 Tax=Okeania hirsuta TaxID=1458930 RepID=A0A3N6PT33_9CYAN|nr:hypothetical protein D5R40_32750 [Okeania hirsuta]